MTKELTAMTQDTSAGYYIRNKSFAGVAKIVGNTHLSKVIPVIRVVGHIQELGLDADSTGNVNAKRSPGDAVQNPPVV